MAFLWNLMAFLWLTDVHLHELFGLFFFLYFPKLHPALFLMFLILVFFFCSLKRMGRSRWVETRFHYSAVFAFLHPLWTRSVKPSPRGPDAADLWPDISPHQKPICFLIFLGGGVFLKNRLNFQLQFCPLGWNTECLLTYFWSGNQAYFVIW